MTSFRRRALVKAFMLFDLCVMACSFALAALPVSYLTANASFAAFLSMRIKVQNILLFLAILFVWHGIFSAVGLYHSKRLDDQKNEVRDVLKATSVGALVVLAAGILFRIRMITPIFLAGFWAVSSAVAVSCRLLLRYLLAWVRIHGRNLRFILIVGTNQRAIRFARSIESKPGLGYRLIGFVDEEWAGREEFKTSGYPVVADCENFPKLLGEHVVDEVVLALPMKSCYLQASRIANQSREQGIIVRFLTDIFDLRPPPSRASEFDQDAVLTVCPDPSESWPTVIKRSLDVVISLAALIPLAPVLLVTAIASRWESPGPIFFAQERIGLNKRRFRMYKFRTMIADAEKMQAELESRNEAEGPVFKIRDDPRVTRIGKFLRKTSIDELPQLYNVLRGDMSLVGPRPLPVRDYQGFSKDWQRRRFSVRPGITCLWQVNGRSTVPFDHWMDLDMQYIDNWSLWLDLKILAKTIPAVLKGTGAA